MIKELAKVKIADIPVGGVAVGLAASGVIDGIIGLIEGWTKRKLPVWLAKGVAAWAVNKYGPKFLDEGAKFATAILAVDAIQSLYDVRGLARRLSGRGISGIALREVAPEEEIELLGEEGAKSLGSSVGELVPAEEYEAAKRGMY